MPITDTWLGAKLARNQITMTRFCQHLLLLDGRGVIYCPKRDTLVVSDLHLEKASFLNQFAAPVPQLDTLATLARLHALLVDYKPKQLICLGDSFHDQQAVTRMPVDVLEHLIAMVNSVSSWVWVIGNHDPVVPEEVGGDSAATVEWDGKIPLVLTHEPDSNASAQLIGHYHPKATAKVQRRQVSGKCFVKSESLLIMPAFGEYTGGLGIEQADMMALMPRRDRQAFLLYQSHIYPFKVGQL